MEIENRTIALLIDSDNISKDYLKLLIDEVSKFGNITYKRIYGDFTDPRLKKWRPLLLEFAIEPIQQYLLVKKKKKSDDDDEPFNVTDATMIIDAMDILYSNKVDCICLATSDSDFTRLAMRFRNENYIVIGAGEQKTPQPFRAACHRFILMDALLSASNQSDETRNTDNQSTGTKTTKTQEKQKSINAPTPLNKLIDISKNIITNSDKTDSDGYMLFSDFMSELYNKENSFNTKLYGHQNSRPASFFQVLERNNKPVFKLTKAGTVFKIGICLANQ